MIPEDGLNFEDFTVVEEPTNTYYLDYEKERVRGYTDGLEAVEQAIYKMLSTEKYQYPIYEDYGVELASLIGKERSYVVPEVERRIMEALLSDERILSVNNFRFEFAQSKYHVTFSVETTYGDTEVEKEVNV